MQTIAARPRAAAIGGRKHAVTVLARHPYRLLVSRPSGANSSQPANGRRATSALAAVEAPSNTPSRAAGGSVVIHGVHHVALICASLETSLEFYCNVLGLDINPDRPHDKLPYRGAWLWIGPEMIHLMELPNPDPDNAADRPQHGGRDRHFCIGVASVEPLMAKLDAAGVTYTKSMSGRPAVFFRDPDANVIEAVEGTHPWR